MHEVDRRNKIKLFKTIQSDGERRGMTGKEINEEAHIIMDASEKRMPTLRELYKRWIFDPYFGKKISDLILPPRKQ